MVVLVVLLAFLIAALIVFIIVDLVNISVYGFPPKDKDVLEFIEKVRKSHPTLLDGDKPNSIIISKGNPYISTSSRSCLMGCYISDVGVIPRWYKSYGEIKKLYGELDSNSIKTKRQKLGL